uniref:Cadherin domain-containing protein n=1 Tax=Timema genevievae TaxID=629358 RepID=A0A7R9JS07_TIMGE|nr:unnamed protein product [Timema genevievae]
MKTRTLTMCVTALSLRHSGTYRICETDPFHSDLDPLDYFLLDPKNGELRTAKPLDKEALSDSTGVISLTIRARELVDGVPGNDALTVTTADATVTIKDVNDEAPTFNNREYSTFIVENPPNGTPLPHLDMSVRDTDVGSNSEFSLRLEDVSGAFVVEPKTATGSTSVNIRVANSSLDYEDPNQRKFIILVSVTLVIDWTASDSKIEARTLVIAEELNTDPRLSSTATVTVSIADANDNFPKFYQDGYTATVSETASPGTVVTTITATDRDSGDFGENGIIYQLSGNGAENFKVNNKTGVITVAVCPTPGTGNCLDFETKPVYYLNYKDINENVDENIIVVFQAMDDNGKGHSTVVPLMIQVIDANDNPPQFLSQNYKVTIDEGATKFDPPLRVQARDPDKSSEITYHILEGNINNLFAIDMHSGEITVVNALGLDMTNVSSDIISLVVEAKDEKFSSSATVHISVRDVNNNQPVFTRESYVASIQEDTPVGTSVEQTQATDADSGVNADLSYVIQKGGYEDFSIDNETGLVKVASNLDYDRRNIYNIEIIAVDHGIPSLTGTTTLTVNIVNSNDKDPYFLPPTQRAEVSEDAATGTVFYTLNAKDPDINDTEVLHFAAIDPITAVDKNGKQVEHTEDFKSDGRVHHLVPVVGPSREQELSIPGPSREQESTIPGPLRKQEPTIPGHSREQELTVLGPLCQQEISVPGPSREQESTIPGPSREQESTIPGPSREQESTIPGPSREQESTIPGPSRKQEPIIPGHSREQEPTIPGPSRKQEPTILGPSCQKELTVQGPSRKQELTLPGPSRDQELPVQGPSR